MKLRVIHFESSVVHPQVPGATRTFALGESGVEDIEAFPQLLMVRVIAKGDPFYYPLAKSIGAGPVPPPKK